MDPKFIVVIGASAGGISALNHVLHQMPANGPAAFFVTLHMASRSESILHRILSKTSGLHGRQAANGQRIESGHIYVAPPDSHLLIEKGCILLSRGPRENWQRPAINPMFRTAAEAYGSKVIGIILSGMLDDGAAGLAEIKRKGGLCIVQTPDNAMFPEMPKSAIAEAKPHLCLTDLEIREFLTALDDLRTKGAVRQMLKRTCHTSAPVPHVPHPKRQTKWKRLESTFGPPTGLVCPECSGPLWEAEKGTSQQFRCLIGHLFSPQTLLAAQGDAVEHALWVALRAVEEREELQSRLASKAQDTGNKIAMRAFEARAKETALDAAVLRGLVTNLPS